MKRVRLTVQQLLFLADIALDGPLWPRRYGQKNEYPTATALLKRGLVKQAYRLTDGREACLGIEITDAGRKRLGLTEAS